MTQAGIAKLKGEAISFIMGYQGDLDLLTVVATSQQGDIREVRTALFTDLIAVTVETISATIEQSSSQLAQIAMAKMLAAAENKGRNLSQAAFGEAVSKFLEELGNQRGEDEEVTR